MNLLAFILLQTDAQTQEQVNNAMAGLGFGIMAIVAIVSLLFYAFFAWIFWRIFTKAGMSGPLGLLVLIPGIGIIIALCILAFGTWRVVPAPNPYAGTPLPPPGYPPQQIPPTNYPPRY